MEIEIGTEYGRMGTDFCDIDKFDTNEHVFIPIYKRSKDVLLHNKDTPHGTTGSIFFHRNHGKHNSYIIYGGNEKLGREIYNSFYEFDMNQKKWTKLDIEAIKTLKGVPYLQSCTFHYMKSIDSVLIYGGTIGSIEINPLLSGNLEMKEDRFLIVSLKKKTMKVYSKTAQRPNGRSAHGMVKIGNWFYIFGGSTTKNMGGVNEFWKFHIEKKKFVKLKNTSSASDLDGWPQARTGHSMFKSSDDKFIYVFGGEYEDVNTSTYSLRNDLWRFDVRKEEWMSIQLHGDAIDKLSFCASATYEKAGKLYAIIHGGCTPIKEFSSKDIDYVNLVDFESSQKTWIIELGKISSLLQNTCEVVCKGLKSNYYDLIIKC